RYSIQERVEALSCSMMYFLSTNAGRWSSDWRSVYFHFSAHMAGQVWLSLGGWEKWMSKMGDLCRLTLCMGMLTIKVISQKHSRTGRQISETRLMEHDGLRRLEGSHFNRNGRHSQSINVQ